MGFQLKGGILPIHFSKTLTKNDIKGITLQKIMP